MFVIDWRIRGGSEGEKQEVFRLSQPSGQVTMTSSKTCTFLAFVVTVVDEC